MTLGSSETSSVPQSSDCETGGLDSSPHKGDFQPDHSRIHHSLIPSPAICLFVTSPFVLIYLSLLWYNSSAPPSAVHTTIINAKTEPSAQSFLHSSFFFKGGICVINLPRIIYGEILAFAFVSMYCNVPTDRKSLLRSGLQKRGILTCLFKRSLAYRHHIK